MQLQVHEQILHPLVILSTVESGGEGVPVYEEGQPNGSLGSSTLLFQSVQ